VWHSVFGSLHEDQHLERIKVPTLVMVRPDTRLFPAGSVESVAEEIPNSTLARLDGEDTWPFVGDVDAVIAEISDFLVGERRVPAPDRTLAAVLFTDLVDSTQRAAALGDAQWKRLLDRHDQALRSAVGRCGGTVVKTTGDGILATFPSATAAVRAADRLRRDVSTDDLEVRIGIHVGDVDQRGEDISGLAVNIAARVMSKAGNGEIYATGSVTAAVAGQGTTFEPVGSYELKGVPGDWELFRVTGVS
jgi:class 3 adenylate cyclase